MPTPVPELSGVTPARFQNEILPAARPVVMRGLVQDWPAVAAASQSSDALGDYLLRFDRGNSLAAMFGPPRIRGRFFYNDDVSDFNFRRESVKLRGALDFLANAAREAEPPALAIQSVPVYANLPGFERENPMPLPGELVEPRIWIGNKVTVAAHHDPSENIACVVAGRRSFTIFPPDQVANLYPGPFELTPAGPIISMVDFDAPDLERFPNFPDAMAVAQTATLEPGDAIYIPYHWWHHVRSTEAFNILVNYWWTPASQAHGRPLDAFMLAMLAVRDLPAPHRDAWRALFDHYIFGEADLPGAHLPPARRGAVGPIDAGTADRMRNAITRSLGKP